MNEKNMETITCVYQFLVYPKGKTINANTWSIVKYRDSDGHVFCASGKNLPRMKNVSVALMGQWKDATDKYDKTFDVKYSEVILPVDKAGVVSYIENLKVGIGRIRAKALYNAFGAKIWDIISYEPEQLTTVRGITERKAKRLVNRMKDFVVKKDLMRLFNGVIDLTPTHINSIRNTFSNEEIVSRISENPYCLCHLNGFNFKTVDLLGKQLDVEPNNEKRIEAAVEYILECNQISGNVCMPKDAVLSGSSKILNHEFNTLVVTNEMIAHSINDMCSHQILRYSNGMLYTSRNYAHETGIVDDVLRLLSSKEKAFDEASAEAYLTDYEKEIGITLADSQRAAVLNALNNNIAIVTGGPGTGKSTIIKAILWVFNKLYGNQKCLLLAPTGKAARRMEEATEHEATTVHSALGFSMETDSVDNNHAKLDAALILVDESSMLDQYIAYSLLKRVSSNSRIVFIGDPEQLPSVGCGNVLLDMIHSGVVPTVTLDVVFRQAKGNPIIENANKIRTGNINLNYECKNFHLYKEANDYNVFQRAVALYLKCVEAYGVDNVIMLNPYRSKSDKTPLTVDEFNRVIQANYNPIEANEPCILSIHGEFHKNDRVMQMKNKDYAKNGDVGIIKEIIVENDTNDETEQELFALVDFNDGKEPVRYTESMMKELDLAYCTTVHKSQGSQYKTVIMVVGDQHVTMLNRATVYTGFTRAKVNVAVITNDTNGKNAFERAILNDKSNIRHTLMCPRLQWGYKQLSKKDMPTLVNQTSETHSDEKHVEEKAEPEPAVTQQNLFADTSTIGEEKVDKVTPIFTNALVLQEDIDDILRRCMVERYDKQHIVYHFMKEKSLEESVAFLKRTYYGGYALKRPSYRVSAWFDKEKGLLTNKKESVRFDPNAQIYSWEEIVTRIRELLDEGTFATKQDLLTAKYQSLLDMCDYFHGLIRDVDKEYVESNMPCYNNLCLNLLPKDAEEAIARALSSVQDVETKEKIIAEIEQFSNDYKDKPDICRMKYCDKRMGLYLMAFRETMLPLHVFSSDMEELPPATPLVSMDDIETDIISRGTSFEGGKRRIYIYWQQDATKKERAEWLKKEHGDGGYSHALSKKYHSWQNHTAKGVTYELDDAESVHLSYQDVAEIITKAIEEDRYLTGNEDANRYYEIDEHPEVLMTYEMSRCVPKLYAQEGVDPAQKVVHAIYFVPFKNWTWYLTEYDAESKDAFGLVAGTEVEWGYFNLDELKEVGAQRFLCKMPKRFCEMKEEIQKQMNSTEILDAFFGDNSMLPMEDKNDIA